MEATSSNHGSQLNSTLYSISESYDIDLSVVIDEGAYKKDIEDLGVKSIHVPPYRYINPLKDYTHLIKSSLDLAEYVIFTCLLCISRSR